MSMFEPAIDLIRELRLRQWARAHYVTESERSIDWHPIVLDEMRRRDEELNDGSTVGSDAAVA